MATGSIKTCDVCKIAVAGQYTEVEGTLYHAKCFKCQICGGSLLTGFYHYDKKLHCEKCYSDKNAPKCDNCRRPIAPGTKCIKAANKNYHRECLVCTDCKKIIKSHEIYPVNGKVYCSNCHFARKLEAEGLKAP